MGVEYKTFESKTALCHLYDHFLVDARIIRPVPKFLGKPFYKRKKFPVQVKLDAKDLSKEVERALKVSCLALAHTGTSSCVTIGLTSMPEGQLCSNLVAAVRLLETKYPGGWANIRALHLLCGTDSLPFYVTLRATKEVGLVRGLKRKNKGLVTDELSTVVGATVTVTPTGGVKVKRVKDPLWLEDGDVAMEVTNEVVELEAEAVEEKVKKSDKKEGKKLRKTVMMKWRTRKWHTCRRLLMRKKRWKRNLRPLRISWKKSCLAQRRAMRMRNRTTVTTRKKM